MVLLQVLFVFIASIVLAILIWFTTIIFQAMNALLELSASSYEQSKNDQSCEGMVNNKEDTQFLFECSDDVSSMIFLLLIWSELHGIYIYERDWSL